MGLQMSPNRHYLTRLFEPAGVAIVGATEKPSKVGEVLISNMRAAGYQGALYAVNPKYRSVHGVPCVSALDRLPQPVDLAVIATPAGSVPQVIAQCARAGIRAAVVITAGFSETGEAGAVLERALLEAAQRHGVRMIGPNCLGIMRPVLGLNATFARGAALPGSLGLVSQSGAVCTAMLDWALPNKVGFSSVVSLGGSVDIDFGEIIDYLANDALTEHILLYIEGIRDARRFLSSLRAAARVKPVILMKVGRHPAGSRAAVSHTGAIVGMDDVFDAAARRSGVVRVHTIGQLVAAAQAFTSGVRPRGNRLAVITNGGGPGVMAADRAGDLGLPLAELSPATIESLRPVLPANWSHGNPLDLIGDADSGRYRAAVAACLADPGVDGVLTILAPQAMTDAEDAARAVIEVYRGKPAALLESTGAGTHKRNSSALQERSGAAARDGSKPLIACWMGEGSVAGGRRLLQAAGIPVFRTPDPAVEMFAHLSAFYRNQQTLMQTPGPLSQHEAPDLGAARALVEDALKAGRTLLGAAESKALLALFRIPVALGTVAGSEEGALQAAARAGYPVVMKIESPDITHKSDAGGVRLNLANAGEVRIAYAQMMAAARRYRADARITGVSIEPMIARAHGRELMIGVIRDPVFGPAMTFGSGGTAVEVHRDRSVALPPLNPYLVGEMIAGTRVSKLLGVFRGMPPVDRAALEAVLLRVSELVCELPWLDELDINPLIADPSGVIALDARVVIRPLAGQRSRYAHMAIHPYPSELVSVLDLPLPDGARVLVRPIRPEDADMEQAFVRGLSDASRHFRFMNTLHELTPAMLVRFTQIDYDREMALVAVHEKSGREEEVGVARYVTNPDGETCEFAIVVADAWQGKGLGRRMLALLIDVAKKRGLKFMIGDVLAANRGMLTLCRALGFAVSDNADDATARRVMLPLVAGTTQGPAQAGTRVA